MKGESKRKRFFIKINLMENIAGQRSKVTGWFRPIHQFYIVGIKVFSLHLCKRIIIMKKALLILTIIFSATVVFGQATKYKKVKIWFDGKSTDKLSNAGVDLLEGDYRKGVWFVSDFSEREIEKINQAGYRTEILAADAQKFYQDRLANKSSERISSVTGCGNASSLSYVTPNHFYLGGMGGYFQYAQLLNILDSMQLLYPNLITLKTSIDQANPTIEGRQIFYVKISDNPNIHESEPEVLYTAVHHAREPESMSQLVFYMWYLLENYSTDTTIRNLVDNTEMYFIPCINPDGYIYNETTDPNGGGLWRKNRRDNLDGEFGVDLNRNYGYEWAYDDTGSSPLTSSNTYRGTIDFSEPETQAIRTFTNAHQFKLALNYHTYGNHLVQSWGYLRDYYPVDSVQYYLYGHAIAEKNNYHVGTPNQTVNYVVNGGSDDWMYGDVSGKPKVFAWTPEVGTSNDGFWPAINRIIPLCNDNMFANLTMARLAGRYGKAYTTPASYIAQTTNSLVYDFRLLGLDTSGNFTVSLIPISMNIISVGAPHIYSGLNLLQLVHDSIDYNLDPSINNGDILTFALSVNNGLYTVIDTFTQYYGIPIPTIVDDASNLNNWNSSTAWGTTTEDFVSPSTSITDSPFNTYINNGSSDIVLANVVDLTAAIRAKVSFNAKWQIEKGFDYTAFQASADGGFTWTSLCGKYTSIGTASQLVNEPLYDGDQPTWVQEEVDLNSFIGQTILLRFILTSDQFQEFDGFYFDDLTIETLSSNIGGTVLVPGVFISGASPNPTSSKSLINFTNSKKGDMFELYNSFGQIVLRKEIGTSNGSIEISTEDLSGGMFTYFIRQKDGGRSKVLKLMVSK